MVTFLKLIVSSETTQCHISFSLDITGSGDGCCTECGAYPSISGIFWIRLCWRLGKKKTIEKLSQAILFSCQGSKRVKYVVTRFYLRLNLWLKERCSWNQKSIYKYYTGCSIVQSKLRNEIKMNSMWVNCLVMSRT